MSGLYRRALMILSVVATLVTFVAVPAHAASAYRVDLRVLVVTDGGPGAAAIRDELASEGMPYTEVSLSDRNRPVLTEAFLSSGDRAYFQAVVLPNPSPFGNTAELDALGAYQRKFGVPQVNAYAYPQAGIGLNAPTYAGWMDGAYHRLTDAGRAAFPHLNGPIPFADDLDGVTEVYGYLADPLPGAVALVSGSSPNGAASGTSVVEYTADGRRQLSLTFAFNSYQPQFRLLAPGIVNWMTGGVHLGLSRNYFSVHVDDVFAEDLRWDVVKNCTPEEDCVPCRIACPAPSLPIRMTPADVTATEAWQDRQDFVLDLVYNAQGSDEAIARSATRRDPLTDELLARKAKFRWTNHTWSHENLGCIRNTSTIPWTCATDLLRRTRWTTESTIKSEISKNITWAANNNVPVLKNELVTGEHSGLMLLPQQKDHNPNLGPGLTDTGITWLAADNSRMPEQITVGSARTVPRYPLNVFFNVGTKAEQLDEYNWIYTSRADGGSGICEDNPLTVTCIRPLNPEWGWESVLLPQETRFALTRILGNDPRPHYAHQSNLAEDRLLLPLMDSILDRYREMVAPNAPIINPRMSEAGAEILRQDRWRAAVKAGTASGYVQNGIVRVTAPAGVEVPLTAPEGTRWGRAAFGQAYGGMRSGWTSTVYGQLQLDVR